MPKLIEGTHRVLCISFSMWCLYISLALLVIPEILFKYFQYETDPYATGTAAVVVLFFGAIGRVVKQGDGGPWKYLTGLALIMSAIFYFSNPANAHEPDGSWLSWIAHKYEPHKPEKSKGNFDKLAVDLIGKWEGKRNNAYRDVVGVVTICYGHTRTAKMGQFKTDEQCNVMLLEEIHEYRDNLLPYFTTETRSKRLPDPRLVAYTSLAYNIGWGGAGKSTATRRLNAGNIKGGCDAIQWFNKAGGRVWRGLVRRRADEHQICMRGV